MGLDFDYIYGQTPITEEEKEGLIIQTISDRNELDEFEQLNIESAVEWSLLRKLSMEKILTVDFILDVHKRMFNKTWKWDWGGILSIAGGNNSEKLYSILPNWNSMNIIYSGKSSSPHFVTPVQSFAKSPRYSITIFIK